MIKTKTVEKIEEYDESGKLVKRTTTETEETDDTNYTSTNSNFPFIPTKDRSGFVYNTGPCCGSSITCDGIENDLICSTFETKKTGDAVETYRHDYVKTKHEPGTVLCFTWKCR